LSKLHFQGQFGIQNASCLADSIKLHFQRQFGVKMQVVWPIYQTAISMAIWHPKTAFLG